MNFWKRLFGGQQPNDIGNQSPRCDHYSFTHVVLREAAFQNPTHVVTTLASNEPTEMLKELWQRVQQQCEEHNESGEIDLTDILIHKLGVRGFPCTLFEMPTPAIATEAFFVALVLTIDLSRAEQGFESNPLRYFTLELAQSEEPDDEIVTTIGEWFADGAHSTHGTGSEPSVESFVEQIAAIISRQKID